MVRFNYVPDYGAKEKTTPRVNRSRFGDGYEQASPDGINHMMRVWSLSFSNRSNTEIEEIKDFLRARAGVETFEFPVPESPTNEIALVKCDDWERGFDKWRTQGASFEFREVPA